MYINAIVKATSFTRAVHSIVRFPGSQEVHPGAATLFFVNADGWALTCKHVAQEIIFADQLPGRIAAYKAALAALGPGKKQNAARTQLAIQHQITADAPIAMLHNFINCVAGKLTFDMQLHQQLDIALIHFKGYQKLHPTQFPVFAKQDNALAQGRFLCRLGFPFAEFSNFRYDAQSDSIQWTPTGRVDSPSFPIEGMVTRHLADTTGKVVGFEMSTPGLRGQSGGPAFDAEGRVWGMQSSTNHLDLNFDVDLPVWRGPKKKRLQEGAIFHVGHCVHVSELKGFMRQHKVAFAEG